MEHFSADLLFTLYDADSGVIPWLYRVNRILRDTICRYLRVYRDAALTIHTTLGDYDRSIYTTTPDGAKNGLFVSYDFSKLVRGMSHDYDKQILTPIEIAQMCNNKRHGWNIVFEQGFCKRILRYIHGERVETNEHHIEDLIGVRTLCMMLNKEEIDKSTGDNSQTIMGVMGKNIQQIFTKEGLLMHKILNNDVIMQRLTLDNSQITVNTIKYPNGAPKFISRKIGWWITECAYYSPNNTLKMLFMQPYKANGMRSVYYDNGYVFNHKLIHGNNVGYDIFNIQDASGVLCLSVDDKMRGLSCGSPNCCKGMLRSHECVDRQMRRDFPVMWRRVDIIRDIYTPKYSKRVAHAQRRCCSLNSNGLFDVLLNE
ncbi:hypothetical protein D5b_00222 [Faustovirus]|nr:hypothetical protein D5b_00222 [Faustovirus]AMN84692.1 hypothetical protein D6_00289 [Faustovirus]